MSSGSFRFGSPLLPGYGFLPTFPFFSFSKLTLHQGYHRGSFTLVSPRLHSPPWPRNFLALLPACPPHQVSLPIFLESSFYTPNQLFLTRSSPPFFFPIHNFFSKLAFPPPPAVFFLVTSILPFVPFFCPLLVSPPPQVCGNQVLPNSRYQGPRSPFLPQDSVLLPDF